MSSVQSTAYIDQCRGSEAAQPGTMPGMDEYYVKTVVFKPTTITIPLPEPLDLRVSDTFPILSTFSHSKLSTDQLKAASILEEGSADIAVSKFQAYENQRAAEEAAIAAEMQTDANERRERQRADCAARRHAVTQQGGAEVGLGLSGSNRMVEDPTDQ
jgi:hypothetical protein